MAKKLHLDIPKPCHEDWAQMTQLEKGRFCNSCQHQVIDFTRMSDRQLAEFFRKPSRGSVCGRFSNDQLGRGMDIPGKRIPWLKYFFSVALPAFFVSKINAQTISCRGQSIPMAVKVPVCTLATNSVVQSAATDTSGQNKRLILGIVMDETGEALPGASVVLKGTRTGVSADNCGRFRIYSKSGDVVVVSAVGFNTTEFTVSESNRIIIVVQRTVFNRETEVIAMGITISSVRRNQRAVISSVKNDTATKYLRVYPNPVHPGETMTIQSKELKKGEYNLQWLTLSGELVRQEEVILDNKIVVSTKSPITIPGSYFLVLTDRKSGKRFTEKIIIQ